MNWTGEKLNEGDENEIAMEQPTVFTTNLNWLPESNWKGKFLLLAVEKYKLEVHNYMFDVTSWDDIYLILLKYLLTTHVLILGISLEFLICHWHILEHWAA